MQLSLSPLGVEELSVDHLDNRKCLRAILLLLLGHTSNHNFFLPFSPEIFPTAGQEKNQTKRIFV